jgi:hypothetical protein
MTNFWLRDNFYRDTAPVSIYQLSAPREILGHLSKLYRDRASALVKFVHGRQKHVPYLSCHRDNFPAKVPGPVTGWLRQVTQPPFIAGPLAVNFSQSATR